MRLVLLVTAGGLDSCGSIRFGQGKALLYDWAPVRFLALLLQFFNKSLFKKKKKTHS